MVARFGFRNAQVFANPKPLLSQHANRTHAVSDIDMFALLLPLSATLMPTSSYHAVRGATAAHRALAARRAPAVVALAPLSDWCLSAHWCLSATALSGGTTISAAAAYFGFVAAIKAVSGSGAPDEPVVRQEEVKKTVLQLNQRRRAAATRGLGYSDAQHEPSRASAPQMAARTDDPDANRSADEPVAPPTKLMPIEYGRVMKGGFEPYLYNFHGEKR